MRSNLKIMVTVVALGFISATALAQAQIEMPADEPAQIFIDGIEIQPGEVVSLELGQAQPVQVELVLTPVAQAPTVDEVLAGVQVFYESVQNYHGDFQQTYSNLALGTNEVSTGHVYFRKPGMMRWDYAAPQEKYLISDGAVLWIYEPEFNQVARLELSASDMPAAVRFLMGEGELADDFEVTFLDECEDENTYCLELVPLLNEGQYRLIEFVVNAEDFSVRETTIVDPVYNRNTFVFSNVSTTDELPESGFQFEPPEDARYITP